MKHFVRILVVILILGVIGGGVWYFAFRTKPNEVVFKELTKTIEHVEDEISIQLSDTETFTGYKNISNQYVNTLNTHVANENTALTSVIANVKILLDYNQISMDAINHYYALSSSATGVKSKERNTIKKLINSYNTSVDNLVRDIEVVLRTYKVTPVTSENNNGVQVLVDENNEILQDIVNKQNLQNQLIIELNDYVNKYVFETNIIDHKSAMYNIYAKQLNILYTKINSLLKSNDKALTETAINNNKNLTVQLNSELTPIQAIIDLQCNLATKLKKTMESYNADTYITNNASGFMNSYQALTNSQLINVLSYNSAVVARIQQSGTEEASNDDISSDTGLGVELVPVVKLIYDYIYSQK